MPINKRHTLRGKCQRQLNLLIGKPLWACGRAADLQWLHFGKHFSVKDFKGDVKEVGEYALHIMCPWRICLSGKIVVASCDRYYSKNINAKPSLDFDWDKPGVNLCDVRVDKFVEAKCPITVKSIEIDEVGGFKLTFEKGYSLDIFPDSSRNMEHWCFF